MAFLRWTSMAIVMLLAGCARPEPTTSSSLFAGWSWSKINPANWFGHSLLVTDRGVGELTALTPMEQDTLSTSLHNNYRLRKAQESNGKGIVTFWQALQDNQVKLEIFGQSTVSRVVVMDDSARGPGGITTGTLYSKLYSKAYGICHTADENQDTDVVCRAPGSQHIWYQFSGQWHGPKGLMPDDETLKNWQLNQIIW